MVTKLFVDSFIFYSSFGAFSRNSPARVKDLCHYLNELGKLLNKTDHYNFKSHKKNRKTFEASDWSTLKKEIYQCSLLRCHVIKWQKDYGLITMQESKYQHGKLFVPRYSLPYWFSMFILLLLFVEVTPTNRHIEFAVHKLSFPTGFSTSASMFSTAVRLDLYAGFTQIKDLTQFGHYEHWFFLNKQWGLFVYGDGCLPVVGKFEATIECHIQKKGETTITETVWQFQHFLILLQRSLFVYGMVVSQLWENLRRLWSVICRNEYKL